MRLRGRRGTKDELAKQPELFVLDPRQYKGKWNDFFGNDRPIHVEFGMGKGQFVSGMSVMHPHINYIGVDRYDELLRRAGDKVREAHVEHFDSEPKNVALALLDIDHVLDVFAENEIERIYLNFSDPWPKKRHAPRRLTHAEFLEKYRTILNENGEIHMKTDSASLFEFSLNSFADAELQMKNITLNLHAEELRTDLVMTEYETKFVSHGMPIYRCEVAVGTRAVQSNRRSVEGARS